MIAFLVQLSRTSLVLVLLYALNRDPKMDVRRSAEFGPFL